MHLLKTSIICAAVLSGAVAFASQGKVAAPSEIRPSAAAPASPAAEETVTLTVTGMT